MEVALGKDADGTDRCCNSEVDQAGCRAYDGGDSDGWQ